MNNKVCHNRPAIAWLWSYGLGLVIGARLPGASQAVMVAVGVATAWLLFRLVRHQCGRVSPLMLLAGLGYLAIQPWVHPQFPSHHVVHHIGLKKREIVGSVLTRPVKKAHYCRCIFAARRIGPPSSPQPVVGRIRLTVSDGHPPFRRGDILSIKLRLRSIHNFNNPGGFDYRRYLALKGVWVKAHAKGADMKMIDRVSGHGFSGGMERFRQRAADRIDAVADGHRQAVLKALLIGDRSQLDQELRDTFNRAGLGHLLAISGLHIGIVAGVAYACLAWMLARSAHLLESGVASKWAACLTLGPVTAYALLAGMTPSTQRALIMVSVLMMTVVIERENDLVNTLAVAALVILFVHPPSLFAVSFQLSFSSVYAIVCGVTVSGGLVKRLRQSALHPLIRRLLCWLAMLFWVSLWAMLGSLPWVMRYFNQVSLAGLFANIVLVPVIGGIVVPLGLLSVSAMLLGDAVAEIGLAGCQILLGHALWLIDLIGSLPWAAVKTITPSAIEMACYYLMLWALFNARNDTLTRIPLQWRRDRVRSASTARSRRGRFRGDGIFVRGCHGAVIAAGLAILVMSLDVSYWLYRRYWRQDLEVTILDVGHGSAAVLELPQGACVLIDGGGVADNSMFDIGRRIVAPFLWRHKIKTVDVLILSHPNADHLNGLIYIAEHFNVKTLWTNGEPRSTIGYRRLMAVAAEKDIAQPDYVRLPTRQLFNGVRFDLLHPPSDFLQRRATEPWRTTNNNSLVVKVSFGRLSILFPGDISAAGERELVARRGNALKSDVLVVPHHGSNSSSTAPLLDSVNAGHAIVSAGKYRHGFPDPRVMRRLSARSHTIYRTDLNGAVCMISDGRSLKVTPFRRGP